MKKFLFVLIAFVLSFPFYGQNQKVIDSLLSRTKSTISNEEEVDAYVKIALEYSGQDSINARLYVDRAIAKADSIGYEQGKMDGWYVQGHSALLRGNYSKSEIYLTKLLSHANQLQYPKGRANGYYAMGWLSYYRGNYEKSIEYHMQSYEIRRELGNEEDVSNSLRGLGITYKLKGEFEQALYYLSQSLSIEQKTNNLVGMAGSLNHIGIIHSLQGYYGFAMDSYFKALDIQKEIGDKSGLAYTYQNIGIIYDQQKEYSKALEYYNRSLGIRKEIGEKRGVAQIISNIGTVHHRLVNYDTALTYYEEALQIKESLGDKRGVADGHLNIGRLFADQGKYDEAIDYKLKSLEISNEINSVWGKVDALISLGSTYLDLENYIEAKKYLLEGIEFARASKLIESVREGARQLAIVEEKLGRYKDAYEAQVLYQKMSDSLSNEETTKRVTLLEAEHQFQKVKDSIQFANEKEKLILDQKISSQRNTQLVTIFTVIVLIGIIGILYRYYRLKNESNQRLSLLNNEINQRNQSLKALNDEKSNLIGIVAHDLQNPLSGIIGATNLLENDELDEGQKKLKEIIQATSSRMWKMITEILNVEAIEKSVEGIHIQPHDLSSTVADVSNQFIEQATDKDIFIQTFIEDEIHALVDERFVRQITENLLSNAVKFSPPNKRIEVRLSKNHNKALLEVKDEGPGISEEDQAKLFNKFQRLSAKPTGNESSTGLGLSIVKRFVDSMGGNIWCESEIGKGASFFVELRLVNS